MSSSPPRAGRRGARLAAPLLVLLAVVDGACAEVGNEPTAATSITYDRLPSPSVVCGDTLRDLAGVATRLSATVYNSGGDSIPDAPIRFYSDASDTLVRVDSATRWLVAARPGCDTTITGIRVFARIGSLRPQPLTLAIVPEPDSLRKEAAVADSVPTVLPSADRWGFSAAMGVRVLHYTAAGDSSLVGSYPVRFEVAELPTRAADSVWIVGDAFATSRRSPFDTTAAGVASRVARVFFKPAPATAVVDTLVVRASLLVRGEVVDTVRFAVPVRNPAATP